MYQVDKDIALLVIGTVLTVGGFVGTFMLHSLMTKINSLQKSDKELEDTIVKHREDVLRNYVSKPDLDSLKKDILDRLDRFEDLMLSIKQGK